MSDRLKAAEYLLDEIGGIDDALLHDALAVNHRRRMPKIFVIAAILVLTAALVIGAMAAAIAVPIGAIILGEIFSNAQSPEAPSDSEIDTTRGLDRLLFSADSAEYTTVSKQNVPINDGYAYLVWQTEDGDLFNVTKPLTARELLSLEKTLGQGERVGNSSPKLQCRVWLVLPDGRVKSPYLEDTSGNTGVDIFDYDAEIYPTEEFISGVSDILT